MTSYDDDRLERIRKHLPGPGATLAWEGTTILNSDSVAHVHSTLAEKGRGSKRPSARLLDWCRLDSSTDERQLRPVYGHLQILETIGGPSSANAVVYKCRAANGADDGPVLALKLYHGQLNTSPDLTYIPPDQHWKSLLNAFQFCPLANSFFSAEADAYKALEFLQGGVIPYSYGFYSFRLPHSDYECIGHALEYIDGPSFSEYLAALPEEPRNIDANLSAIGALYTSALLTIVHIHFLGIKHSDVASRNMKILSSRKQSAEITGVDLPVTVLFDFSNSTPIKALMTMGATAWHLGDLQNLTGTFIRSAPVGDMKALRFLARKSPETLRELGVMVSEDGSSNVLTLLRDTKFLEALSEINRTVQLL